MGCWNIIKLQYDLLGVFVQFLWEGGLQGVKPKRLSLTVHLEAKVSGDDETY